MLWLPGARPWTRRSPNRAACRSVATGALTLGCVPAIDHGASGGGVELLERVWVVEIYTKARIEGRGADNRDGRQRVGQPRSSATAYVHHVDVLATGWGDPGNAVADRPSPSQLGTYGSTATP